MAELIVQTDEETIPLTEDERKLANLIMENSSDEYSNILRNADWTAFYHLSVLREGLLNWYPFNKEGHVLEISDGFGAITGVLGKKCKNVTVLEPSPVRAECIAKRYEDYPNITILSGNVSFLPDNLHYDYIVFEKAINTQYEIGQMFHEFSPFLKRTGKLLFVCENRFGMKYWCGVPESVTGSPFAGIRGKTSNGLLTRKDIIEILERNPYFQDWNMYYPFPDHIFPQAVYTDKYLPQGSTRDRVIPYYSESQRDSLVCLENEISDALIANGVFQVFSNSFFLECGFNEFEKEILFSSMATDRDSEHSFITVITSRNIVRKNILYPDGKKSLLLLHNNARELSARGINCVPQALFDDAIELTYIKEPRLIDCLKYFFNNDVAKIEIVFNQLYHDILQSSEFVPFSQCTLKDRKLTEENAGPILRKAYIDMIPYNCFYVNGELLFFDQEFVMENFPAKYVLFRALRYTYIYIPEADDIKPLQYFKEKFRLQGLWGIFEQVESKFVGITRNYELMSSFYHWSDMPPQEVDKNIEKLLKKEKPKALLPFKRHCYDFSVYKKDKKLNELKEIQLDLLKIFIDACTKYDLSYSVFYGTLLGVIRHQGYIPWDDDLDLLMPREDYDKLLRIAPEVFCTPYFLQTPENDPECFYGGYCKLRNSNTTALEERNKGHKCNQGIWIDIFPLDYVLRDEKKKLEQQEQIKMYQRLLLKKAYPEKRVLWDLDINEENFYNKLSKNFSHENLVKQLYMALVSEKEEKTNKVAVLARYWSNKDYIEYEASAFEFLIRGRFENIEVYLPVGYEECLQKDYGIFYKQLPLEKNRVPHHKAFFDVNRPFDSYIVVDGEQSL